MIFRRRKGSSSTKTSSLLYTTMFLMVGLLTALFILLRISFLTCISRTPLPMYLSSLMAPSYSPMAMLRVAA